MYKSLPPLQLLSAFEAAHRLRSFKEAATELHVTPSAISQQIRALEQALGVSLFDRRPREIVPTEISSLYAETVRQALGLLDRGARRLRERDKEQILRVSAEAFVAHEYIVPSMSEFRRRVPGVDLRVETSSAPVNLRHASIDAAIRFYDEQPDEPGVWSCKLQRQAVLLVCAPSLRKEIRSIPDVATAPIVAVENRYAETWEALAQRLDLTLRPRSILWLDSYYATIRAAEKAQGVAIALRPCVDTWIGAGRLAEIPGSACQSTHAFYFLCREADAERREMAAFVAWVQELFRGASHQAAPSPPVDALGAG